MAKMTAYINLTKTKGVAELSEKIKASNLMTGSFKLCYMDSSTICHHIMFWQEAISRLAYLLDVHIFKPDDVELNSTVFLWPKKIHYVFESNDAVL